MKMKDLSLMKYQKKEEFLDEIPLSGERGIRTLDTLLGHTHFPGVLLRPLGHFSFLSLLRKHILLLIYREMLSFKIAAKISLKSINVNNITKKISQDDSNLDVLILNLNVPEYIFKGKKYKNMTKNNKYIWYYK